MPMLEGIPSNQIPSDPSRRDHFPPPQAKTMKAPVRNLSLAVAATLALQIAACKKPEADATPKADPQPSASSPSSTSKADPKAFADSYLEALKAKDTAKLDGMMLTDGVPAETLEFFTMMRGEAPEGANVSVEVTPPSAEDLEMFGEAQEMPDGKMYRMPMAPSHLMKISMVTKDENGESTSSSSMPIAEKDGRFVILLPVPVSEP